MLVEKKYLNYASKVKKQCAQVPVDCKIIVGERVVQRAISVKANSYFPHLLGAFGMLSLFSVAFHPLSSSPCSDGQMWTLWTASSLSIAIK